MEESTHLETTATGDREDAGKDAAQCQSASGQKSSLEAEAGQSETLPHTEAMERVKASLAEILATDPFLRDLPAAPTVEEVSSLVALEHGQAMLVSVVKGNQEAMPIVVHQDATVVDLKHAIQRFVALQESRRGNSTGLSWRYVWKRFWLYFQGQKLTDNNKRLKEYGIRNREEVTFIKRLRER